MFTKILLVISILNLVFFAGNLFAQENETPETIIQRELYIQVRRAGGPGKVLPFDAYSKAMEQKKKIIDASQLGNNINSGWVNVNPSGMFYNVTGADYISGRTNSIAFHPTDPNTIYIAAAGGGVWKTTNGGTSWIALTDGLSSIASGDIVVNQSNPNILYYGTGEANYSGDSHYGLGIFKSTDAGATWNSIATSAQVGSYIAQIAIDPTNSSVLYAAGTSGVFKSTNAGTSWTNTSAGTYANCVIIDPTNTQVIFTTTGGYFTGVISKSTNGGGSWTTLTSGLPSSNVGRIQLAMAPSNHLIIYASIASSATYALLALCKTTNSGSNWTTTAASPNPLGSQGWYDNAITVNPTNANTVVVGGLDIYLSTDGGVTLVQKTIWSSSSSADFSHADIHRLAYNGANLYCGSDGGVYESTNNGAAWTNLNQTLSTLQFQGADYDPSNVLLLYGGCQDNDKETSSNGGTTWVQRTTGDGGYTLVDPVNTNYIYSQYVDGSLYRSNNFGVSFTSVRPSGSTGGLFYNPFEMASGDHNTIIYAQSDVWKTSNAQTCSSSSGWTQIATTGVVGGSNVSAIGISPLTTNKIYVGTDNGTILVTTNNGGSWSSVTGFPYVTDFVVDNVNDAICYASFGGATGNQVSKTTNSGATWTNITGNLPNIAANSLILNTTPGRVLVVGMDAGVYYTANEGTNWIGINTGLPNVAIYDMKYHSSAGLLMVATHGRGCWTYSNSPLPVYIAFFTYSLNVRNVTLRWATQQEINDKGFYVQRMQLGESDDSWINIGFVQGHGTTTQTEYYSYEDDKLSNATYKYRLVQTDYNGDFEYYDLNNNVEIGSPLAPGLSQNYPNPSNPKTKIDYQIPQDAKVVLKVYDVTGREVAALVNEFKSAGYYTTEFDGTNLASGVYFYKLEAGNFSKVMKMVLLK